jgi:hypothetical protein
MMEMNERIPVVIPTMPQRADVLATLLQRLKAYAWADVRVSEHVDSRLDTARAVALASVSRVDWWLYLEDDVELSLRFGEIPRIIGEAARISQRGKRIGAVCFFWTADLPDGLTIMPASKMSMSQCTAMRGCKPLAFADFARDWYAHHPQHRHASDLLLGAWTAHQGELMAVYSPSLVQHLPLPSTLGSRSRFRQSKSYPRALADG